MGCRVVLAVVLVGCAAIQKTETVENAPLPPDIHESTVRDSLRYAVAASPRGEQLHLTIEQFETCATVTTDRVHRRRFVANVADASVVRIEWGLALAGLLGGGYGYVNADALALRGDPALSPGEYRASGAIGMGLGLVAAAIASIDSARAIDDDYDDGTIDGVAHREESECRRGRASGKSVTVVFTSGDAITAKLDHRGNAELALIAIQEADLASPIAATIGDARMPIVLLPEDLSRLRMNLLADPGSRVARDVLAIRRARCNTLTTDARAATTDERAGWLAAKSGCEELWTNDLEAERLAVDARLEARRCSDQLTDVVAALDTATTIDDVATVSNNLVVLSTTCTAPAQLAIQRELVATVGATTKRITREQAAESQRLAHEQAREAALARAQEQREAARARLWGSSRLVCNDGSLSPSCTCGGSHRGCCSHHGGVDSCSADR